MAAPTSSPQNRRLLFGRQKSRSSSDSRSQQRPVISILPSIPGSPYSSSHRSSNSLPMSLESALDEERLKIVSILQGNYQPTSAKQGRSGSSSSSTPVRSMLDVPLSPRKANTRPSSASQAEAVNNRPKPADQTISNSSSSESQSTLPIRQNSEQSPSPTRQQNPSSQSEPQQQQQVSGPGSSSEATQTGADASKTKNETGASLNASEGGDDPFAEFAKMRENRKKTKKRQRQQELEQRRRLLAALPSSGPEEFIIDASKLLESNNTYRRLSEPRGSGNSSGGARSDEALAGLYAMLTHESSSGENGSDAAMVRLQKDDIDEEAVTTSDEDNDEDSSSDEDERGRKVETRRSSEEDEDRENPDPDSGPKTLLGSVEEERLKMIQSKQPAQKYKSLLDPPPEEKQKKGRVHPFSSFDEAGFNTPFGSDDEAVYSDIRTAQNLSIYLSPEDASVDGRIVQTMVRGEWESVITELKEENRRQRTYLVATDLSEEAEYALEWTFGTIVRDGDTIHVVYALEEGANRPPNVTPSTPSAAAAPPAGEAPAGDEQRVQDIVTVVGNQTEKFMANSKRFSAVRSRPSSHSRTSSAARPSISRLSSSNRVNVAGGGGGNNDGRAYSSTGSRPAWGEEGKRALARIVQKCMHLLRKTRLQVRVAVVVIACKNAGHLITEAIDGLSPTMVILGSRGRSALKNVLLGSFSNYLVNKSSVPVMVARKKLRKHSAKYRSRQTNNLRTPRSLAAAKID